MSRFTVTILLSLSVLDICGQTPVGSWSDHLSYNTATAIAVGTNAVYASTGSSLLVYDRKFAELKKLTRIDGLSETGINEIAWSEENNALIIGYKSTNIDILINNTIFNVPDIYKKYIAGKKEINRIRSNGKYAYLACSFGIVVMDITRKEIYDTWKPGSASADNEVWDISAGNGYIYAATGSGIYSAPLSGQGLSYYGNWRQISDLPDPAGNYTSLILSGGMLFANKSDPLADGDSLFEIGSSTVLLSSLPGVYNRSIDPGTGGFTVSSGSAAKYYGTNGSLIKTIDTYGFAAPDISQSVADEGDIWIADNNSGLVRGSGMTSFSVLSLPGPLSNNAFSVSSYIGKTVICGGGNDNSWNSLGRSFQVSICQGTSWTGLSDNTAGDAMRSCMDPRDESHIFISTWGEGLLEYKGDHLVNHFTDANSPLQTIVPGRPYVRICGLAMDGAGNLWITQSGVPGSVKVLKPDGGWIVNPVNIDAPVIGDIIITKNGYKWIILPGGHGIFVLDDNKTVAVTGDDRDKQFLVKDAENQIISLVYSMAEDLEGNIWIGTDQGPLVYFNPENVFNEDIKASRIKIPRNDGSGLSDYLLNSETITTIAVDGANRKWLGTSGSGAYNVSSDGLVQLANFNELNSPILSDSIISMAVDNKTGDIWFGTSRGLQSYRGNATAGAEKFTRVYAFPNPVREDFTGNVTITGLVSNTQINITDISGNLVYETVSDGGQATWDLKTYNGKRVSTGVYLIFCASSDGTQASVIKILVIR